jgi:hypothetical protein
VTDVRNHANLIRGIAELLRGDYRRSHDPRERLVRGDRRAARAALSNTGIASSVWLLSDRKKPECQGLVQLIDARDMWAKMGTSLGEKRRVLTDEHIAEITRLHGALEQSDVSKLVPVEQFGHRTIVVDRPLRAHWSVSAQCHRRGGSVVSGLPERVFGLVAG